MNCILALPLYWYKNYKEEKKSFYHQNGVNVPNGPAFKRRGKYDLVEVAKLIPGNQVPSHPACLPAEAGPRPI